MRAREEHMAQVPSSLPSDCFLPSSQQQSGWMLRKGPEMSSSILARQRQSPRCLGSMATLVAFSRVANALPITIATCREPNKSMKVDVQSLKPPSFQRLESSAEASNTVAQECGFLGPVPTAHTGLSVQPRLHLNLIFFFFRWPSRDPLMTGIRVCTDS